MGADPDKPLDLGTGVVCASFGAGGAWLSVGTVHPVHGFVELSGMPAFDERRRGDPAATRRHRLGMADARSAFLTVTPAADGPCVTFGGRGPSWWGARAAAAASGGRDSRTVLQCWRVPGGARLRFAGTLDRPALAEITELEPPLPTGARTRLVADGGRLLVLAESLPAAAVIQASVGAWRLLAPGSGEAELLAPGPGLELRVALAPRRRAPDLDLRTRPDDPPRPGASAPHRGVQVSDIVERALSYVRGCTALRVAARERVILTDHRILPLSWTRDAYHQALLLLAADGRGDRDIVAAHLRWLWARCERPDGRWVRSHHANGRRKDVAFQADQQLYPMLELADYWRLTGELPAGVAWDGLVRAAWQATLAEVDGEVGLIGSTENAADDPAALPYIAGSQVLLWYAARRLAEMAEAGVLALDAGALRSLAGRVREVFGRRLIRDGRWLYAVDATGAGLAYHDANDLPIALAPLWSFCRPDDPAWRRTMDVAFSPANPGFAAGPRGGLGSVHTAGPWALGDVQAWVVSRLRDDAAGAEAALERLAAVAFGDGMLPEAYAADGPLARIRHWFAWPGAALGALLLLDRDGILEQRLAAR
jgi:hypothetical protein